VLLIILNVYCGLNQGLVSFSAACIAVDCHRVELGVLCIQMSVESARYEFVRLHEWPFNSDTKYMAVKVTPRRTQVCLSVSLSDYHCLSVAR